MSRVEDMSPERISVTCATMEGRRIPNDQPVGQGAGRAPALFRLLDGLPERTEPATARVAGYLFLLAAPVVLLLRQPGTSALSSLWAEDGPLFLTEARELPVLQSVFRSYGGYLHVPSRLISELATHVPLADAPVVMSGLAAVVAGLVSWFVFRASRYHVESVAVRILLALIVLVLPAAGREVLATVTNLHWFLLYGAIWALLTPARRTVDTVAAALVVLAATTADPMTLLLAPLALARLFVLRRRGRDHVVTLAFAAGGALHAFVLVTAPSTPTTQPDDWLNVVRVVGGRVVTAATVGESTTFTLLDRLGWAFVAGMTLLVIVGLVAAFRGGSQHARALALVLLLAGAASLLLPLALRWENSMVPGLGPPDRLGFGERYFVVPHLCLVAALLCLLAPLAVDRRLTSRVAVAAAVVVVGVSWARDFRTVNARADSVEWGHALQQAKADCERSAEVPVPITPDGWAVTVPCSALE